MDSLSPAGSQNWESGEGPSSSERTILREGGGRPWTPSVNGSLRVRGEAATPVQPRSEFDEWNRHDWASEASSWEWSWQAWGEGGRDDPWSSYLDSQQPGWRERRYSNWAWEHESSDAGLEQTPEGAEVPLPRLLDDSYIRSPKPTDRRRSLRAQWDEGDRSHGSRIQQEPRHPVPDHPQVPDAALCGDQTVYPRQDHQHPVPDHPQDLRCKEYPRQDRQHPVPDHPQDRNPTVYPKQDRQHPVPDHPQDHRSAVYPRQDRQHPVPDHPQDPQGLSSNAMLQGGGRPMVQGASRDGGGSREAPGVNVSEDKGSRRGEGGPSYLKLHSSFPPEFRARPGESWKDYWRAVEFWLASEGVNLPPAVRSSRLMQQLKERAAKIVNHLSVEDVACDDGVNIIKREMEKSPIIRLLEHKEVDRKRQKFMRLARLPGESLESFINRASIYRHENDQCQNYKVGSKFYLGHLLDAAKLTRKDEALVKTAAGGLNDETKVVNALLELADQLEGMPGFAIGRGEPDMPNEDEYLVQKRRHDKPERERPGRGRWEQRPHRHDRSRSHKDKRTGRFKKWKQVFHAMLREESDGSSSSSGSLSEDSEGPTGLLEDDDEEEPSSSREDPVEGQAAPAEVFAQEYKARRKVNELKKMRQYFQKGSNQERTQAWVKEQQKREPCFLCQKLGHWSQECPLRKKGGSKSHPVHVTAGPMRTDPDQWSLLEAIAEYTADGPRVSSEHVCCVTSTIESSLIDHEIFWSMRELSSSLILDLGCMKSVAGTKWVNQHIQRLKELGRWMKAVPENESFRFGDGHELRSSYSFMFEATLMGVQVIIRLSVVPGECPPLLSKPACSQLSMVIDTEFHTVSSRKLKVRKYGLKQTYGGHYALPIAEFGKDTPHIFDPPVPVHLEAVPVYVAEAGQAVSPESRGPSTSSTTLSTATLRSWTRQDKQVNNTVGPGRNGPPWELVVRRIVFETCSGNKILDEEVCAQTRIRRSLSSTCDTTTIFMFRVPGSGVDVAEGSMRAEAFHNSLAQPHGCALSQGEIGGGPHQDCRAPPPEHGRLGRRGLQPGASREFLRLESHRSREGEGFPGPGQTRLLEGLSGQGPSSSSIQVRGQGSIKVVGETGACEKGRQGAQQQGGAHAERSSTIEIVKGVCPGNSGPDGSLDNGSFEGPGGGTRDAFVEPHGPHQHRYARLQEDKGVLGAESDGSGGGVGELPARADGDRGARGEGAGQGEFEWRRRLTHSDDAEANHSPREPRSGHGESGPESFRDARSDASGDQGEGIYRTPRGGEDRQDESGQGEGRDEGARLNGSCGPVPLPVQQVFGRCGDQPDAQPAGTTLCLQVEDLRVDAEGEEGDPEGIRAGSSMAPEPSLADATVGQATRSNVGSSGVSQAALQRPEDRAPDAGRSPGTSKPSRGLTQKLRRGTSLGLRNLRWLTLAASWQYGLVMMEVFNSGTPWHQPGEERQWKIEGPLWDHMAPPSFKDCGKMMEQVRQVRPDVLIIGPPRGPWSSWSQEKEKTREDLKAQYWPMWNMIEEMWHYQHAHGRLVLLQVPARMMPPGPDEMRQLRHLYFDKHPSAGKVTVKEESGERTPCYATRVDLCQWGAVDPSTQKLYKRACRVEVNDPWWCSQLAGGGVCQHAPGAHQEVSGRTKNEAGDLVSRAAHAQQWPLPWAQKVLDSSHETLELRKGPPTHCVWHQECAVGAEWEAVPVEVEPSPEGQLRQRLGEATGDQYDYIYFEGASGALSRQVRSTLAKLHVVLGHVTNDKLKRMLHLNGAKQHLLDAAGDLRCQVCQKVTAPKPPPRVSYERPQRFNQRVVTDVFYVWDANNTKYAVVHALDAFALYQVATLMPTARADLVAHFLKNYWLAVFGPPEVLMSDAGSEYAAATESLLRAYDVYHEVVPPGTKWRMGLAERHGAVLKLLVMKTIHATTARGHSETKECVVAATAARNRQMRISGFSPVQIVLGKDVTVSSSLLEQIERGHFRYVLNQDLAFDEARRRNEQIRQAAEHAFVWMNGHETLRKALNAKSRHPRMEMLYEGAQVYFYEPPSSRKGLPRRLQDQISWMGPAVVAAIERREGNIRRVWVRYRTKLKGVPLEYIRLAALEEVEATKVCQDALKEVEKELEGGRPDVDEMLDDGPRDPEDLPDIFEFSGDEEPPVEQPVASALDDVPAQLHRDRRASFGTPSQPRKKVRFDEGVRATEEHLSRMRAVLAPQEPQERARASTTGAASSSAAPPPAPPALASHRGAGVLHVQRMWHLDGAVRGQRKMLREAKQHGWTVYAAEVESVTHEVAKEVANFSAAAPEPAVKIDMPVTGKPRLEYKWGALSEEWKRAFLEPLKKTVDVYVDNDALEPVPLGPPVPPEKVLPSRFVLTNKSDKESLEEACLKARWVLAGHLDKEAGQHATEAPTASLVAHNIVCFLSAQMRWKMRYADISAAFLQGEYLDEDRVVFVKLPRGYPDEVREHLGERLKAKARGSIRLDLVRLTKGGFGLSESPRLWYLRLKRGLHEIGLRELKLSPGTFVFHVGGALRGVLSIHVDDLRIAFHPDEEKILDKLQGVFRFGDWKEATQETVKFCGRWEKQCPETFQIVVTMSGYVPKLKEAPSRPKDDRSPLTEVERKWVSSVGGQLLWMARQGRADLAFGISKVQQLAGAKDPTTIASLNQLVTKAREPYEMIFQQVPGKVEDLVFLAVSDASHGSMPKGRSQGGMMILLANNEILEGPSLVNCVLYHSAVLKRVVRSSLAAEISQAAETMDQCEYVRAMFAEIWDAAFSLPQWRWSSSMWPQILVLDSRTGYDVLNSISNGEDKRLAIDIAILKESLYEPDSNRWVRWVPGLTMPSDGLTKQYGNDTRDRVMQGGPWSLKDSPEAQRLRMEAGHRKRQCKDRLRAREQALEEVRQGHPL